MRMPEPWHQFAQEVALAGYRWKDLDTSSVQTRSGRWLTPRDPDGHARVDRPLAEHSGLCRILAATEPSEAGVQAFADQFGLLGTGAEMLQVKQTATGAVVGIGEPLSAWQHQIGRLRSVIDVWEQAVAGDVERLARHIRWAADGTRVDYVTDAAVQVGADGPPPGWEGETIWMERHDGPLEEAVKPGDLVRPAFTWVARRVNQALKDAVATQLGWNAERTALRLQLMPRSLAGAAWLQLASAIERNVQFRQCAECGTWFEVSPGVGRANKLFHSAACRTRAYRRRQAEAHRLLCVGKGEEEIARELDVDLETLRSWLAQPPRSEVGTRARRWHPR
jgi:hypothetical protein